MSAIAPDRTSPMAAVLAAGLKWGEDVKTYWRATLAR